MHFISLNCEHHSLPFQVLISLILADTCLGLACLLFLYTGVPFAVFQLRGMVPVHRLVLISLVSDVRTDGSVR